MQRLDQCSLQMLAPCRTMSIDLLVLERLLFCRLEWDIQRAARNALRLHAASLPALACALLLLRVASYTFPSSCLSSRHTFRLFPACASATHHADKSQQLQAHTRPGSDSKPAFKSNRKLPQSVLYGTMLIWAATASWLWPQLAIAAGWMSHRRPSLPSVTWSAFLLLLAEGLLEAFERVADLVALCGRQLPCMQGGRVPGALACIKARGRQSWLRCVYALLTAVAKLQQGHISVAVISCAAR